MSFVEKLTGGAEYVTNGFHAIPAANANPLKTLPSMHRLLNAAGMAMGFSVMKYLGDIAYGHKINGAQYEEIPKEKVPPSLRFLHGVIHCNPFSDDPKDQWLKVAHQLIPAVGAAYGAVKGSEFFFVQNGTQKDINTIMAKVNAGTKISPLEAEKAVSFAQGKVWRMAAGLTAWVSSATGLTGPAYGGTLNPAFLFNNGAKTAAGAAETFGMKVARKLSNTTSTMGLGPNKALAATLNKMEKFMAAAKNSNNVHGAAEKFGEDMAGAVFEPFFRRLKPEGKEKLVKEIQSMFENAYSADMQSGQMKEKLEKGIHELLASEKMHEFGEGIIAGNNGWLGKIAEKFDFSKTIPKIRSSMVNAAPPVTGAGIQ